VAGQRTLNPSRKNSTSGLTIQASAHSSCPLPTTRPHCDVAEFDPPPLRLGLIRRALDAGAEFTKVVATIVLELIRSLVP
jgi:hypothetical protein